LHLLVPFPQLSLERYDNFKHTVLCARTHVGTNQIRCLLQISDR
jgi:hypothetical protein